MDEDFSNKNAHSRVQMTEEEWDGGAGLIYTQDITQQRGDQFARTRRGSFVMASLPHEGMVTVDILHSERTRVQLDNLAAIDRDLAKGSSVRRQSLLEKSKGEYKPPAYPATSPHVANVDRYQWSAELGFKAFEDGVSHSSGDFSDNEQRWVAKNWPGELQDGRPYPEGQHHSETRYAMSRQREKTIDTPVIDLMKGGHDMCRNCQEGLKSTVARPGDMPIAYTGGTAFNSLGEWRDIPDIGALTGTPAGHYTTVENSSITRSRPEEMMTDILKQDHIQWAQQIREKRGN